MAVKMKGPILFVLLMVSNLATAQTVTIKGKVISPIDTFIMQYALVTLGDDSAICDTFGEFSLTVDKSMLDDPLKINFIGFRPLYIKHFPKNMDTIDLGEIPMFAGYMGVPMVEFFCKRFEYRCKRNARLYWENFKEEKRIEVTKANQEIEKHRYVFNKANYKLQYNENYFSLFLVIDLRKPEND